MSSVLYTKVESYEDLSDLASERLIETIEAKDDVLITVAGGDTPVLTLKYFVNKVKERKINIDHVKFISLDEWVGLDGTDEGSCRTYLNEYLFHPLEIKEENIFFFDGKGNLEAECNAANAFVEEHGPLGLSILGVGVNGHLGFNEPYSDLDNLAYVSELDENTKQVGKKYFNGKLNTNAGITLGLRQLMASEKLIVIANGESKKTPIDALKTGEYDPKYTVTVLNKHDNSELIFVK